MTHRMKGWWLLGINVVLCIANISLAVAHGSSDNAPLMALNLGFALVNFAIAAKVAIALGDL